MKVLRWVIILLVTSFFLVGCSPKGVTPEQGIINTEEISEENQNENSDEQSLYIFEDFELTALDGTKTNLYAYGGKTIVLNFWTTWCRYCSQMLPYLDILNQEEDVVVLAVSVGENLKTVNEYIESKGYTFEVALDEKSNVAAMFGVAGFPTTFFIGPNFEYYTHAPGLLSDLDFENIMLTIRDFQANQK